MIRVLAAVFLRLHGCAHLLGFLASWQLATFDDIPYTTTIANGTLDVGDAGIRIVAFAWIVAGAAMLLAGLLVGRRSAAAVPALWIATVVSLIACVSGLPAAVIGLAIDLAIVAVLLLAWVRTRRPRVQLVGAR